MDKELKRTLLELAMQYGVRGVEAVLNELKSRIHTSEASFTAQDLTPGCFEMIAGTEREEQIGHLRRLLAKATVIDKSRQNLVSAVTQLEKKHSREEVWRTLQAFADNYRAGVPLSVTATCLLAAEQVLDKEVVAAAAQVNSRPSTRISKKPYRPGKARSEKLSKAKKKPHAAYRDPLPADVVARLSDRVPLAAELWAIRAAICSAPSNDDARKASGELNEASGNLNELLGILRSAE